MPGHLLGVLEPSVVLQVNRDAGRSQLSDRLRSWSVILCGRRTNPFLRSRFGHQQGKEDEAADGDPGQGDETDGVTERLNNKARTEVA